MRRPSSTKTIADATTFSLPRVIGNFASCLTLPREQTLQIFCTDEYRTGKGKVNEEAEVAVRPHPTHARKRIFRSSPETRAVERVFFTFPVSRARALTRTPSHTLATLSNPLLAVAFHGLLRHRRVHRRRAR